jgi:ERCC4-related helicase
MEEFYFYSKNNFSDKKLPVIIGLTASPSKNAIKNSVKQTAKNSLQILSENLDCKVIIDPEMRNNFVDVENFNDLENIFYVLVEPHVIDENYNEIKELLKKNFFEKFTNLCFDFFFADEIKKISDDFKLKIEKKNEYVKIYNKLIDEKFNSLNLLLFNQIDEFKINNFSLIFKVYEKIQRNIFLILENLDVFSLQKYFNENVEVYYNLIHKKHNEKNYINEIEKFPVSILKKILEIFENFKNSLEIKLTSSENYQSDRIKKMKNELSNQLKNNPKSKIVIFVQNRIVAYYLEEILNNYFKSQNISCVSVIGINRKRSESGTVLNPNNTLNELNSKIKKFNSNESQILIGTSAIEEGLDFQSCNSVLVFTQLNTAKSYIQMKGRARMKNNSFKVFTNEIESTKNNIKSFVLLIQEMKEFFKYDFVYDFRRKGFENNKSIGKYFFKFKNSQAKITLKNVSMLFHEVLQQANNLNYPIKVKIETKKIKNPNLNPEFFFVSEGIFDDDNKINFKSLKKNVVDGKIKGNSHKEKNNSEKEIQMRILVILYKLGYLNDYVKFQIPK